MEFFNIGILEFTLILLIALIVLGPQKAIKSAGKLGRCFRDLFKSPFWRDLISTSREIKDLPRKFMDDAAIQETLDEIERSTRSINRTIDPRRDPGPGLPVPGSDLKNQEQEPAVEDPDYEIPPPTDP